MISPPNHSATRTPGTASDTPKISAWGMPWALLGNIDEVSCSNSAAMAGPRSSDTSTHRRTRVSSVEKIRPRSSSVV